MLNKMISLLALVSMAAFSATATAEIEGSKYSVIQFAKIIYSEPGINDIEPSALVGRFGSFINDTVAVEGRVGAGLADDSGDVFGSNATVEVDTFFGVYVVPTLELSGNVQGYGVLGITKGEVSTTVIGSGSFSKSETDVSFGLGINFGINESVGLSLEYMSYLSKSEFDVDAISLGIKFGIE